MKYRSTLTATIEVGSTVTNIDLKSMQPSVTPRQMLSVQVKEIRLDLYRVDGDFGAAQFSSQRTTRESSKAGNRDSVLSYIKINETILPNYHVHAVLKQGCQISKTNKFHVVTLLLMNFTMKEQ